MPVAVGGGQLTSVEEEPSTKEQKAPSPRRQLSRRYLRKSIGIGVAVAVMVGLWAAVVTIFHINAAVLPYPSQVVMAFVDNFHIILKNAGPTALSAVVGYAGAVVLGVPLGWLLSRPTRLQSPLNTGMLSAQIFPKIAIAPLLIVWFGFGPSPRMIYVLALTFFPIALNSASGFLSVSSDMRDYLRMLRCNRTFGLRKVELFAALPNIFTGLKISASYAVIAAIVFEFVGANSGLGYLVLQSENGLAIPLMFAIFLAITMIGFAFYGLIALAEALAIPWHISRRQLAPSTVVTTG